MTRPYIATVRHRVIAAGRIFMLVVFLLWPASVLADAASIAQGYQTVDSNLAVGMAAAVSSEGNTTNAVERASLSNKTKFVGIVTTKNANLVTLTNAKADVVVATSGDALGFVTDVNGPIERGDPVAISPLKGIFMKAVGGDATIVGTALEAAVFDPGTTQQLALSSGKTQAVSIGSIRIQLNAHDVSSSSTTSEKSFLQIFGEGVTGRILSNWQVIVVLIIFILLIVAEAALIYGAVHSTIQALGRNPLARDAVYKQLLQVIVAVLAILAFGLSIIYAILQI